jgi:hypothetical protein
MRCIHVDRFPPPHFYHVVKLGELNLVLVRVCFDDYLGSDLTTPICGNLDDRRPASRLNGYTVFELPRIYRCNLNLAAPMIMNAWTGF